MPHVPFEADLVGGLEDFGRTLRETTDPVERAPLDDLLHERVRVEPLVLGDALERLVHERQERARRRAASRVLEGEREDRLDPGRSTRRSSRFVPVGAIVVTGRITHRPVISYRSNGPSWGTGRASSASFAD